MDFLKLMSASVLLFTGVGWAVGHVASQIMVVVDADMRVAMYFVPIGVGAGIGLFIGVVSSVLTLIAGRTRPE